jgi:hypothetical protein
MRATDKSIHCRPEPEVAEEEKKIILERLATYEHDKKSAVDAHETLAEIRRKLKYTPAK